MPFDELQHRLAAANVDRLAGDAFGKVRREVTDQFCNLIRFEEAPDRHAGQGSLLELFRRDPLVRRQFVDALAERRVD